MYQQPYGPNPQAPTRVRRRSRVRGCGCLLLVLAAIGGPFVGAALTHGRTQTILAAIGAGIVILLLLLAVVSMAMTRRGREALGEGCAEGCMEALLGGFLGG
jgi:hypothetical protein